MEVSVIIPVYNAAPWLDQCIRSALDQPEVIEVITVDDGSTDDSYEKLQEWATKEEKVKLYTHPNRERKRAGATRNVGLRHARGEYIAFLDADDYFYPHRFRWTKETIDRHSGTNVVFECVEIFKEKGSPLELPNERILGLKALKSGKAFEMYVSGKYGYAPVTSFTFHKELLQKIGYMDETLDQRQDKDYIYRLCIHGQAKTGVGGRQPVVAYRYHQSNTVANVSESRKADLQFYEKWVDRMTILPLSIKGKLTLLRHYMVSKYCSYNWPILKKGLVYPFLMLSLIATHYDLFFPIHTSSKIQS